MIFLILFLIVVCVSYFGIYASVKKEIKTKIEDYMSDSLASFGIADRALSNKLNNNKEFIATFGALGWPLYFLFYIGATLGGFIHFEIYKENEDRIASWFV